MLSSNSKILPLLLICALGLLIALPRARGEEGDVEAGEKLVLKLGCMECHTIRGEGGGGETKAPDWADLYGTHEEIEDGEPVLVDDEYLRTSIIDPDGQVTKGYPSGKMPTRFKHLKDKDLSALVAYVKSLSTVAPPSEAAPAAEAGGAAPAPPAQAAAALSPEEVAAGEKLVLKLGCMECHTIRGEGGGGEIKAPDWADLYGSYEEIEDGEPVLVDDEYLRTSIIDPDGQVTKGYPSGKMPTRFKHLKDKDLSALVAYVKSLSTHAPPSAVASAGQATGGAPAAAPVAAAAPIAKVKPPEFPLLPGPSPSVMIWVLLGFFGGIVTSVNIVYMSKNIGWQWIGLILVFPAVGVGGGMAWALLSTTTGGEPEKNFEIVATQFAYNPSIIKVHKGDHINITLRSEDVLHGFYVDGYDIDQEIRPDVPTRFSFVASKTGKFGIRCSHTCGVFHPFMIGNLIVEPNYLFSSSIGLCFGMALGAFVYVAKREEE